MRARVLRTRERRVAPAEIRDAVETWARTYGGHGDVVWVPRAKTWQVRLTLRHGDPRLKGRDSDVFETVELQEWWEPWQWEKYAPRRARRHASSNRVLPGYRAYELDELGATGIIEILEKGSLMSGRGEFKSAEEAMYRVRETHRKERERAQGELRQHATDRALDQRRQVLKIPFLPVGVDLRRKEKAG